MRRLAHVLIVAGAALALSLGAFSLGARAAEPEFPALTGRVVDGAGLLSAAQRQQLAAMLQAHEARTTNQVVVVTLVSLQGLTIEDFGYRLGRHWAIGQKDKNNGALLIVAPKERKVRIEVGYGLEGVLTDALSKTIVETAVVPRFKAGDMAGGIVTGTEAILSALEGKRVETPKRPVAHGVGSDPSKPVLNGGFLLIVLLIVILNIFGFGRRRRGYLGGIYPGGFGGSGSRGGGFSGGGGGFGGGGASGGW